MKTEVETVWAGLASAVVQTGGTTQLGRVYFVVQEDAMGDAQAAMMLPPEKARALAALLLKHADRAEGKAASAPQGSKQGRVCEGYESAWDRAAIECRYCGRKKEEHWGDAEWRQS